MFVCVCVCVSARSITKNKEVETRIYLEINVKLVQRREKVKHTNATVVFALLCRDSDLVLKIFSTHWHFTYCVPFSC